MALAAVLYFSCRWSYLPTQAPLNRVTCFPKFPALPSGLIGMGEEQGTKYENAAGHR